MTYADTTVALNSTYVYRVAADNIAGTSAWSTPVTVPVAAPAAPSILTGVAVRAGSQQRATITWSAVPGATSYVIQRSLDATFATGVTSATVGSVTTYTTGNISRTANWYFRMAAVNVLGQSGWSGTQTVTPAPYGGTPRPPPRPPAGVGEPLAGAGETPTARSGRIIGVTAIFEQLAATPLLLLAVLLALGAAIGHVRVAGVRLGPAAVLFAALGVSAWATSTGVSSRSPRSSASSGSCCSPTRSAWSRAPTSSPHCAGAGRGCSSWPGRWRWSGPSPSSSGATGPRAGHRGRRLRRRADQHARARRGICPSG